MPYPLTRHTRASSVPELRSPINADWEAPREAPIPPPPQTSQGTGPPDARLSYVPALPEPGQFHGRMHSFSVGSKRGSPRIPQEEHRSRSQSPPRRRLTRKSSGWSVFSKQSMDHYRSQASSSLSHLKHSIPGLSLSRHHTHETAPSEEEISTHKYFVRRPRALQLKYGGRIVGASYSDGELDLDALEAQLNYIHDEDQDSFHDDDEDGERRSTDNIEKQRERLELFIDLLFVGIITALGEHWYKQAFTYLYPPSLTISEFILFFIPTWRIWSDLQQFLSSYYMDDMLQRIMLVWVMALALIWGNYVPYFLPVFSHETSHSPIPVAAFMIIIISIRLTELLYSIWIPWMRRIMFITILATVPSIAAWASIIAFSGWPRVWCAIAAIGWDLLMMVILASPIGSRLQGKKRAKRAADPEHTRRRFEQFFVICLGEGIFLLLRGSPLGAGWHQHIFAGCFGFLAYFSLHYIYFNGDQTKRYVHAVHRRWYIQLTYTTIHLAIYTALVLASSSVLYLIQCVRPPSSDYDWRKIPCQFSTDVDDGLESDLRKRAQPPPYILLSDEGFDMAKGGVFIGFSVALFGTLILSLLNRPLDKPGTLWVNNRWLRLLPRFVVSIVFAVIWRVDFQEVIHVMAIVSFCTFAVYLCEFYMSMESDWQFFEPKRDKSTSGTVTRSVEKA